MEKPHSEDNNVRVIVRERAVTATSSQHILSIRKPTHPAGRRKKERNDVPSTILSLQWPDRQSTLGRDSILESVEYEFDACYDGSCGQELLFEQEMRKYAEKLLEGHNCTIFAYGATGTGKTFTMQGTKDEPGVIPRVVSFFLEALQKRERTTACLSSLPPESCLSLSMTYLEVYNNKLYDLLGEGRQERNLWETNKKDIQVPHLTEISIEKYTDFKKFFQLGTSKRAQFATKMNETSSRSHAVLTLLLEERESGERERGTDVRKGRRRVKMNLIDLAGNENNKKTGNRGERMTESGNINLSLFVLDKVIQALNNGDERVPYRDSKLTRLLQDSLGGRTFSMMICTVSPLPERFMETYHTLNYASKTRRVVNMPTLKEEEDKEPQREKARRESEEGRRRRRREEAPGKENKGQQSRRGEVNVSSHLLSPMLRRRSVLSENVQSRLESLETRLLQKRLALEGEDCLKKRKLHAERSVSKPLKARNSEEEPKDCSLPTSVPSLPSILSPSSLSPSQGLPAHMPDANVVAELLEKRIISTVNDAELAELLQLRGIGPRRAAIILEERQKKPFSKLFDLKRIGLSLKQIKTIAKLNASDLIDTSLGRKAVDKEVSDTADVC